MVFFRILSFFRWLDDNLSAGLLQQHIKRPEAHLDRIIVVRVFLFFCGLRKVFSEFCQKTSGRIVNTLFHIYRGKFARNRFSFLKSFYFLTMLSDFEKTSCKNLGEKCWQGRQFFFQTSRENIWRKIFYVEVLSF